MHILHRILKYETKKRMTRGRESKKRKTNRQFSIELWIVCLLPMASNSLDFAFAWRKLAEMDDDKCVIHLFADWLFCWWILPVFYRRKRTMDTKNHIFDRDGKSRKVRAIIDLIISNCKINIRKIAHFIITFLAHKNCVYSTQNETNPMFGCSFGSSSFFSLLFCLWVCVCTLFYDTNPIRLLLVGKVCFDKDITWKFIRFI